jgi:quercetin dioxygenase-like cupin family protein
MAIPHAAPGQVIDVRPLGPALQNAVTTVLVKSARLEVIRLVVKAGKEIPPHHAAGEITVQCLEGRVNFKALGRDHEMTAGQFLYLSGAAEHSVHGIEDSSLLLTILL